MIAEANVGEIGKAVTSGIMALIGSVGGAYFVAATQADLWRKEATFKFTTDYFNRRIEIYRSITGLMAEAQRLKILHGAKGAKGASIIERTLYCVNTPTHAAVESCQFDLADKDGIAVARDVLDLHGKFESFRVAAGVYFCNSTRDALRSLPTGGWWWNAQHEFKEKLLHSMEMEMTCDFDRLQKGR